MKKIVFSFLTLFLLNSKSNPQSSGEYETWANQVFQHVNHSTVSSGLLKDYGLELIDMEPYNGIPCDSNYVDMEIWRML